MNYEVIITCAVTGSGDTADKHPDLKSYYFGNLSENRVQFTIGRDITLEPAQDGDPLNYFIYPQKECACWLDAVQQRE